MGPLLAADGVLHRRLDGIDTVGRIIAAGIRGTTVREIAAATRVPSRIVRDIRTRYREHAPALADRLLALSVGLGHGVRRGSAGRPEVLGVRPGERRLRRPGAFRRDPSPSTAAEPSPRNPAGSSPNSAAGNTCCRRFPPLGKIE